MAINNYNNLAVPINDQVTDRNGLITRVWTSFFRILKDRIDSLGVEKSFQIQNNVSTPEKLGLVVNKEFVGQAIVDFVIQRITTGGGAVELVESGSFVLTYLPTSNDWNIHFFSPVSNPNDSGVDLTISNLGEVLYASSNITGTPAISRIVTRTRVLSAKSTMYSSVDGGR